MLLELVVGFTGLMILRWAHKQSGNVKLAAYGAGLLCIYGMLVGFGLAPGRK